MLFSGGCRLGWSGGRLSFRFLWSHVLKNQRRLKPADGVLVDENGLCMVLRFITGAARLTGDHEGALARGRPVRRSLSAKFAVSHEALGMADLMGGRLADHVVGVEG